MNDPEDAEESLARRLEALEQRVAALEQRTNARASLAGSPWSSAAPANGAASASHGSSVLALLGKAMLAIAGAYLLRAATADKFIPQIPLMTLAIAYAFAWLIPAARTKAQDSLPSLIWAGTSTLIFLPMIWEMTLRFRILPVVLAASILGLYVVVAAALGWKRHFEEIGWIAVPLTGMAALALAVAAHNLIPFIATLLVIAGVAEMAVACQRTLKVRPLVAAVADVAVFALIWIYSGPAAARTVYAAAAPLLLLLAAPLLLFLYAGSVSTQTILLRRGISIFEIVQTLIAFLLTCWSFLAFWSGRAEIILGALCILSAVAGYALSFAWFRRVQARRNYHVYASGSLALLLVGCFLSMHGIWLAITLLAFAVAVSFAALRIHYFTLEVHALAALIVVAVASHSLRWSVKALAGSFPGAPGGIITMVAVSAVLCAIPFLRSSSGSDWHHLLALAGTAVSVFVSAALLVWGAVWCVTHLHAAPSAPHPQYVAVIRTAIACLFALALAGSGSKWKQQELAWLAWGVLALTPFTLLVEDMRTGHLAFTAVSIFLYAMTLLFVARLIRPRAATQSETHPEDFGNDSDANQQ